MRNSAKRTPRLAGPCAAQFNTDKEIQCWGASYNLQNTSSTCHFSPVQRATAAATRSPSHSATEPGRDFPPHLVQRSSTSRQQRLQHALSHALQQGASNRAKQKLPSNTPAECDASCCLGAAQRRQRFWHSPHPRAQAPHPLPSTRPPSSAPRSNTTHARTCGGARTHDYARKPKSASTSTKPHPAQTQL